MRVTVCVFYICYCNGHNFESPTPNVIVLYIPSSSCFQNQALTSFTCGVHVSKDLMDFAANAVYMN